MRLGTGSSLGEHALTAKINRHFQRSSLQVNLANAIKSGKLTKGMAKVALGGGGGMRHSESFRPKVINRFRARKQVAGQHRMRNAYKRALARKLTSGSIAKGTAKALLKRSGGQFFYRHRRDNRGRFA